MRKRLLAFSGAAIGAFNVARIGKNLCLHQVG